MAATLPRELAFYEADPPPTAENGTVAPSSCCARPLTIAGLWILWMGQST